MDLDFGMTLKYVWLIIKPLFNSSYGCKNYIAVLVLTLSPIFVGFCNSLVRGHLCFFELCYKFICRPTCIHICAYRTYI